MNLPRLLKVVCCRGRVCGKVLKPFPSYDNSAADDFEHILSKKLENLYNCMDNL